jgi:hypothetical protein
MVGTPGAQTVETLNNMDSARRYEVCHVTRYEYNTELRVNS